MPEARQSSLGCWRAAALAAVLACGVPVSAGGMDGPELHLDPTPRFTEADSPAAQTPPLAAAYRRTVAAFHDYQRLAREDDGEQLPSLSRPVEPGQDYAGVARLARLLRAVGDLRKEDGAVSVTRYEGAVVEAVKSFQRRHGLEPDGRLGPATLRQLNVPLRRRAAQLEVTLLRWRSIPPTFGPPYIVVNIPEFRLHASDGDARLSTNVVVGNAYRSRTPVFLADLRRVIFRPWWYVPESIQRTELAQTIAKNPRVLDAEQYVVVDRRGTVLSSVPPIEELTAKLRSGEVRLRQRPGPKNALGLVKFDLPNSKGVYLHGTPSQRLFSRARRDFSHGCVRVEDAAGLTRWVLRDVPGWTPERIDEAMSGTETLSVVLPRPIPVLIVYGTAIVREDGEVRFFDDVYGYDAELVRALETRGVAGKRTR